MPDEQKTNSTAKTNFFLGFFSGMALISIIAFFILLIVVFSGKQPVDLSAKAKDADTAKEDVKKEEPQLVSVPAVAANDYFLGAKDAKVVLIEYTDFECPFCLNHSKTSKKINETYGDKIKFVVRHFPLSFHENAQKAAEAAECAGEQGKFWQMYDVLFATNEAKTMGIEKWKAEAKKMGLNVTKFSECLDSGKYADKINQEIADGAAAGVDGTPATFINGQLVSGALPFEQFKSIIDGLLK
ncbi:thioredoxin domain-containing protein [Candidatus Falkowbacteria bacterium]|nr:thioredoxin domain-containing protein [Candidatus Falkowbacteria bacterium]